MGVSTNAEIGFGIQFEEDFEFPWNIEVEQDSFDGDESEWWRQINGFDNPFDWENEREKYREFIKNWEKEYPIPFQVENYCSCDYPMYVLLVPGTNLSACRGNPNNFTPEELKVDPEALKRFLEFVKKYNLSTQEPKWLLFSYWG